jgi:hypothetical protein
MNTYVRMIISKIFIRFKFKFQYSKVIYNSQKKIILIYSILLLYNKRC